MQLIADLIWLWLVLTIVGFVFRIFYIAKLMKFVSEFMHGDNSTLSYKKLIPVFIFLYIFDINLILFIIALATNNIVN